MSTRSERSRRRREKADIPVSSFADIAFLLIIFFLVATSLQKTTGFRAELPAGQKSEQVREKTNVVKLHDGRIFLNDRKLSLPQLKAELVALELASKPDAQDRIVLLENAGNDPWQRFYEVMAAIKDAGGVIGMTMEEDGSGGEGGAT